MFITVYQPFSGGFQDLLRELIPERLWLEFYETRISNLDITRIELLFSAYRISILNPIFGLGSGSFPVIFELQKNLWKGHPHNIILELAISFGYPAALLFLSTISILFIKSAKIIFHKKHEKVDFLFFERAWWTSIFLFFMTQLFDVQYFEGRISVVTWIMLCGLKLTLEEKISSTKITS